MNFEGSSTSLTRVAADGLCVIDPVLSPGKRSGTATFWNVAVGAAGVMQSCVMGADHTGGSTRNIGKRRWGSKLIISLIDSVGCFGEMPGSGMEASCRSILDNMPYGEDHLSFGPAGPEIDVVLPKVFTSRT